MRRHCLLFVFTALLLIPAVHGQGRDDGSFYSRYGIGELNSFASSQAHALGDAGVALFSYDYMNFSNPATWSRQTLVRVAVGAEFDQLRAQDAAGRSEQFMRGNFNTLQIGVPLVNTKLGLGFSYEPYSRIHYKVSSDGTLQRPPSEDLLYRINHEGSGGLHLARIGMGLQLTSWASIGASADFLFGITEEIRRTTFGDVNLLETNVTSSTRMTGITSSLGIAVSLDGENHEFVLAASGRLPVTLDGTRTLTLGESLNLDTLGTASSGDIKLPYRLSGGVSFRYQNRWLVSAEVRHEPWSTASTALPFAGYESDHLRDRTRYSGGVELVPAGTSMQATYLRRIAYRLGFYRDNLYVSPVAGRDITVSAITGGFGLPTLFLGSRLDISFEIGSRGSTNFNLIRDRFIGVSATLNIGERWFVKRRLG
ncbi:MAG: hypothetical protein OXG94_08050 [Bacteroidetes bacterium]|nr:hypothetical protein [Bacteroidota bacterium]